MACDGCQEEAAAVLSQSCTGVAELSLSACLGCHDPGARVSDGPDPYFSALHARHIGRVDCTGCHRWSADGGFAVLGDDGGGRPLSKTEWERIRESTLAWATQRHLSRMHGREHLGCAACHLDRLVPGEDRSLLNARCESCRGSLEELAQTAQRVDSSHRSHLLDIECTDCHAGHSPSEVYCHLCHALDRPPSDLAGGVAPAHGPRP